jgi:hypothetical protein
MVADDTACEAGQDRRQDRAPRPLHGVPAGRGRGAAGVVRRHPAPDRWPAATVAAAPGMRIGSDERRRLTSRGCVPCLTESPGMLRLVRGKPSDGGCGQPHGQVAALRGLRRAAKRRRIAVQEPANGESRLKGIFR